MDNSISRSITLGMFDCESVPANHNCPYCDFTADLWLTLREHVWNHQEGLQNCRRFYFNIENYSCTNCDFTSHSLLVGFAHEKKCTFIRKHKDFIYGCEGPDYKTERKTPLRKYLRRVRRHRDPGKVMWFQCDKCEYKAKIKRNLYKHVKRIHLPKDHKCNYCALTTSCPRSLRRHITARHTDPEEINWFKCNECEYKAKQKYILTQHINRRHARENLPHYRCSQCSFKTTIKRSLKRHKIAYHTKAEDIEWFKCNKCEYKAKEKSNLKKHIKVRHPTRRCVSMSGSVKYEKFCCESVLANYNCPYCDFIADLWITIREHVCNQHEGFQICRKSEFNVWNYSCENCDFTSYSSLVTLAHARNYTYIMKDKVLKKSMHKTKRTQLRKDVIYHQCSYCSFKTVHRKYLRMHNITRHTDPRKITWFQCSECEYKAKAKPYLDAHIKRIHLRAGHKCSKCPFITTSTRNLKRHIIVLHSDPKEINWFPCGECEFKAKLKRYLDAHIKQMHLREDHKCSYCSFTTTCPRNLKKHIIRRHTDPEEINWFKCDECRYKARQKWNLSEHIKLKHARENLVYYECTQCTFRTAIKESLKRHMTLIHTKPEDIKWFKCDECEYKSKRKDNLRHHINVRHLREGLAQYQR